MVFGLYREVVRRRYEAPTRADEIHRVACADDVVVAVKRFRPLPGATPRRLPVICVPGLGADSTNFDAPDPFGFAPWLAQQGFDTWCVDLRGTGLSTLEKARWSAVTFDDFVSLDMPAVLDHVARASSSSGVQWVGHSMGGLILYAMLARGIGARVHAAVTLGSPLGFPQHWQAAPLFWPVRKLGDVVPGLHVTPLAQTFAPFAMRLTETRLGRRLTQRALSRLMVVDNMDAPTVRRLMYRAVQSIPRGVMLQFRDWIDNDAFRSKDGLVDYRARLSGCTTPIFVVAAPEDGVARHDAVTRAHSLLPNATTLVAGKDGGLDVDYGHVDMLFGKTAPQEIYPRVRAYLAEHDERRVPRLRVLARSVA